MSHPYFIQIKYNPIRQKSEYSEWEVLEPDTMSDLKGFTLGRTQSRVEENSTGQRIGVPSRTIAVLFLHWHGVILTFLFSLSLCLCPSLCLSLSPQGLPGLPGMVGAAGYPGRQVQ